MKNTFFYFVIISFLFLSGCDGNRVDNSQNGGVPQGMIELDLTQYGYAVIIYVPDATAGNLEVVEQSWGAVEIKVGKTFQLSVKVGEGDIALKKSDIAGNDVNKFKRYVVDEPNALLWESQIMEPEFHLYAVVKIGDASYEVEDIAGEIFPEAAAVKMLESAKAMKAAVKKEANS